jgi:3',5'-nucleoside bisphosphate phosphatase
MKSYLAVVAAACGLVGPAIAHESIAESRRLEFPQLTDGRFVLAVDLHTHSVFSDGDVWPNVRVREAERDGLFALAVTEHLEAVGQKRARDIPHPDRNRSWELAQEAAKTKAAAMPGQPVVVINGAEITRDMPPGHLNAVFISNANELMSKDANAQIAAANRQGAFVFWNHPFFWEQKPDGLAALFPIHREWIRKGMLHGIEVANGIDASDEAFQIALDHNLTILGVSDVHGLIDWEYKLEKGQKRTVTLVLSPARTPESVKESLFGGATVALENDTLIGRPEHVQALASRVLRLEVGAYMPKSTVIAARIVNESPIGFILENAGPESIYQGTNSFVIPARSSYELLVNNVPDPAKLGLTFNLVNTYIAPRKHLQMRLEPRR